MALLKSHLPAGKVHDDFSTWAKQHGIVITKVKVAAIPNAGIGIVATGDIKAGESLVFTPISTLLTREVAIASLPPLPQRIHKNGTERGLHELRTHALMAAVLATDSYKEQKPWQDVWPDYNSFKQFMPLLWPKERQELLTPSALSHVNRQREKFEIDYKKVKNLGFQITKEEYEHAWVIVNTRTLFYKPPSYHDVSRDDSMCMCPFIDYFNHSDEGCKVELSTKGFTVTSNREYKTGEQVFVSYGPHNNDFLLCEYGFILDSNKYDDVNIDTYILPRLTHLQKEYLSGRDFLSGYNLDATGFCFRTQVALRMSLINLKSGNISEKLMRWQRYIDGADDGFREEYTIQQEEKKILEEMRTRGEEVLEELDEFEEDGEDMEVLDDLIRKRWKEVMSIIEAGTRNFAEAVVERE